jgi:hypothetical protein
VLWLVRGAVGFVVLLLALQVGNPFALGAAFLIALFAFGGCPMCWMFGLIERVGAFFEGRSAS